MISRRIFMKMCSVTALGSLAHAIGTETANALNTDSYRALVSIFLNGGNDSNNMVLPFNDISYGAYRAQRRHMALTENALTPPVTGIDNRPYVFHGALPDIARLFSTRNVAVIANTGVLIQPITRNDYLTQSKPIPQQLFSHPSQVSQWDSPLNQGGVITGWGGRVSDVLLNSNTNNSEFPSFISLAGNTGQGVGQSSTQLALVNGELTEALGFSNSKTGDMKWNQLNSLLSAGSDIMLIQAAKSRLKSGLADMATLNSILAKARGLNTRFPNTQIGSCLEEVAKVINVRNELGKRRQIFYCSIPGFDTHENQLPVQHKLLGDLNAAMVAFYEATREMGVAQQVVTFTESEFSRTFQPTPTGSDHGWGGHQLVMGGAVRGGQIVGQFPSFEIGGEDDVSGRGSWIPTTSVDQFAGTLASWFGLSDAEVLSIFPNLQNYQIRNLGFLS